MTQKYSIAFIIGNELCERFAFYGLKAVLPLYLTAKLMYDEDQSKTIYHLFSSAAYFAPLLGAIIADSWLGKFRTIFYLSIVYVFGNVVLSSGAIPTLGLSPTTMTFLGLLLIALGTGGIKPCVAAFGGDQFKLPEQAKQLALFFSLFYAAINFGSIISTIATPLLRVVSCFGESDCYSLAFGVPSVLMVVAIVIFVCGSRSYVKLPRTGGFQKIFMCIGHGLAKRIKWGNADPQEHWLDYAKPKYGHQLVQDIKVLFKVLVLYLPLPLVWALFDQQGSAFTFQALRMDRHALGIHWQADQLQVLNPILIIVFIPIFKYAIYPLLAKVGVHRPLQKITLGCFLILAGFIASTILQSQIIDENPELRPDGQDQTRLVVINGYPCDFRYDATRIAKFDKLLLSAENDKPVHMSWTAINGSSTCPNIVVQLPQFKEGTINTFLVEAGGDQSKPVIKSLSIAYERGKNAPNAAIVMINTGPIRQVTLHGRTDGEALNVAINDEPYVDNVVFPSPGAYNISVDNVVLGQADVTYDQKSLIIVAGQGQKRTISRLVLLHPYGINVIALLPQYILMTAGEIMFSITGLEFSYTEAPSSMKSIIQACWLLTVAVGNLFIVILTNILRFYNDSYNMIVYCVIVFVDLLLFMFLAYMYQPVERHDRNEDLDLPPKEKVDGGVDNEAYDSRL